MSQLSSARDHAIVRITGGCANMSSDDAQGMSELFLQAFTGFGGVLLIGGTRMIDGANPSDMIPGITEVGPIIRMDNPDSVLLGVVGRADRVELDFKTGLMVIRRSKLTDPHDRYPSVVTTVHPHMDGVVILGKRYPKLPDIWHDEAYFCTVVSTSQRQHGLWSSVLVVYNGGKTTRYEAQLVADLKWPVVLIRGSGRAADELASDGEFLAKHPNVVVCDREAMSLRLALVHTGVIDSPPARERLRAIP